MDRERNAQEVLRLEVVLDECHSVIKHLKYEKNGDRISHVAMIHRLLKEKDELSRMSSRRRVPKVEAKSSKPFEIDDKAEGIETMLSLSFLEREKNV
ncbi:hypothetical protein L3X38_025961 [Prunus dulcis]|uniref:Uncharacterized protein n=1 Tax=Prunus dulcis TaxID=3755 RepID=A0AAD4Z6X1_PRUDU|nr:hypothetical protein L3X38_025961 [Prunus dulcis]